MRSLKLVKAVCYDQFVAELTTARCATLDCDTGLAYFAAHNQIVALNPEENRVESRISLDEHLATTDDDVVALQHLPDEMALSIALRHGDILLYHTAAQTLECVGSVTSGVQAMQYSPDQELVVIVTGDNMITIMNREFDTVLETELHSDDFGEAKFVNAGWGRKETQFHGSVGKEAAREKVEDVVSPTETDDGRVRISWRGDGQYFAVSCLHRSKGSRVIQIWTREGVHHSTSETANGLEHSMDWKPSGSLIATTQQLPNKHVVRFFEKNGLMHGEFCLPLAGLVRELRWNKDSSILCVWIDKNEESVLQLWTVSNYHWYLKQSISEKDKIGGFQWDPEHDCKLHYWLEDGRYFIYEWVWSTFGSQALDGEALSSVLVIDGCDVMVTPFRLGIVPPPMCGYKLKLSSPASDVSCSPTSNRIAVFTVKHDVIVHDIVKTVGGEILEERKVYSVKLPEKYQQRSCRLHHTTFLDDEHLLMVAQHPEGDASLYLLKLVESELEFLKVHEISGYILSIVTRNGKVAIQHQSGKILQFDKVTGVSPWLDSRGREVSFPQPCSRMDICSFNQETAVLGMTNRYRFYVDSLEVASNCTSFFVHDQFVLLSTLSHTIRCIARSTALEDLTELADDKAHPFDECVRRVERGSRIVTALAQGTSVILQMPRGNLETIYPRALVLALVRQNLDNDRYDLAFMLMKKHRINMNLIHDHNPGTFMKQCELFVKQIGNADHLNLFLTELVEQDVTVSMYDAAYKGRKVRNNNEKVDKICEKMLETLIVVNEDKFFLSVLTCYVRKRQPDLGRALSKIRELKGGKLNVTVDEAMKYLLYLVDVNQLYDVALGTYDFDLVLMVAEKSQKDPKEYLPLLNRLKCLEEDYMKFTIDKLLKRYSGALHHIVKCSGKFEECLELVVQHGLYTEALGLFRNGSEEYERIAKAQGEFLEEKRYYEEAGLAYWKAQAWQSAVTVFTKALCWREALCAAQRFDNSQKKELAIDLANKLKDASRYKEAAEVLDTHVGDYEEAIVTLIDGELWSEALSLIYRYNRFDFIETNLKPKISESFEHHLSVLPQLREQFDAYYDRLIVVRNEKERARFELITDPAYNDNDADLYSDVTSASGDSVQSRRTQSSFFSTASSRTNRSKRKAEKKKFSLKQGSVNEDLALIDALQKLIQQVEQCKTDIGPLLKVMVLYDLMTEAMNLQDLVIDFLDLIKKRINIIWLEDDASDDVGGAEQTIMAFAAQQRRQQLKAELNKEVSLRNPPLLKRSQEWKLRTLKSD